MPIIKSAKKKMKQAEKHAKHNREIKAVVKQKIKVVTKSIGAEDKDLTKKLSEAFSEIDKAAKRHVIHKNTAARKKSRLARLISSGKEITTIKKKRAAKKSTVRKVSTTKKAKKSN